MPVDGNVINTLPHEELLTIRVQALESRSRLVVFLRPAFPEGLMKSSNSVQRSAHVARCLAVLLTATCVTLAAKPSFGQFLGSRWGTPGPGNAVISPPTLSG